MHILEILSKFANETTKEERFMETKKLIFRKGHNTYMYRGLELVYSPTTNKFIVSPKNSKLHVKPFELERKNVIDVCHYIDLFVL